MEKNITPDSSSILFNEEIEHGNDNCQAVKPTMC